MTHHLIVQKKNVADAVMPSKLTGILSVGGRVIITADIETELGQLVVNNPGIATLVSPENPDALAETLLTELSMKSDCLTYNKIARNYATAYLDIEIVLAKFERECLSLLSHGNA